jgi:predicted component of type VI protein secretion system
MDSLKDVAAGKKISRKRDPKLHSAAHVLADELANLLNDRAHFGFYLKMAVTHPPDILRKLAGEILENRNVKTPGKLFAYLIKKRNEEFKKKD